MMHSESIAGLATALVAAQVEIKGVAKNSKNPDFGSKYASLDDIVATVRPILASHGLVILQGSATGAAPDQLIVETRLVHSSGEWIAATVVMPIVGRRKAKSDGGGFHAPDPQAAGSALTYGRRYGLGAILSLATEPDDDGNAASRPAPAKRSVAAKPERTTAATEAPAPTNGTEYHGAPADRPMPFGDTKDQPLSAHSTAALKKVKAWCIAKDDAKFGPLVKDITAVIAERSLGMDDTSKVERMKAGVAAEDAGLPFP